MVRQLPTGKEKAGGKTGSANVYIDDRNVINASPVSRYPRCRLQPHSWYCEKPVAQISPVRWRTIDRKKLESSRHTKGSLAGEPVSERTRAPRQEYGFLQDSLNL
jgi:hypothetical protein